MSPRRITVVASEILGMPGAGGAGTADSLLAVALGRHGYRAELLVAPGRPIAQLSPEWTEIYDSTGVLVRPLEPRLDVRPPFLGPTMEVFYALRAEPPDVVIADDWRGLAYAALRARDVGLALPETTFVVHCHGPARMLAEFARKVPDTLARFGEEVAERASVELADAVVSPSAWLLEWMRDRDWPVPDSAKVIQCIRRSAALDETPVPAPIGCAVRRLAFFGQLREGKGIRLFLAALGTLEHELLDGVELVFLGRQSARWRSDRIAGSLSPHVKERVAAIRFETDLDRESALKELCRPGTLAVMPSLLDNSPNTVSECIEHGVPFFAARVGGIPELVADADRDRVLFEPTTDGLVAVLRQALTREDGVAPARPAREPHESPEAWLELVESLAPPLPLRRSTVTRVAVVATGGEETERRARQLANQTRSVQVDVVPAASRGEGIACATADWLVFLDENDEPHDMLIEMLVRGQAATEGDVVTCAVWAADVPGAIQLFLGSPGSLGLVENQYGVIGLVRRTLADRAMVSGAVDPDWPLFSRLALSGARIVSIPEPLALHRGKVGRIGDVPGEGLVVLRLFEQADGVALTDLPSLAATLAAAHARARQTSCDDGRTSRHVVQRSLDVIRAEGIGGLARKAGGRITRIRGRLHQPRTDAADPVIGREKDE